MMDLAARSQPQWSHILSYILKMQFSVKRKDARKVLNCIITWNDQRESSFSKS